MARQREDDVADNWVTLLEAISRKAADCDSVFIKILISLFRANGLLTDASGDQLPRAVKEKVTKKKHRNALELLWFELLYAQSPRMDREYIPLIRPKYLKLIKTLLGKEVKDEFKVRLKSREKGGVEMLEILESVPFTEEEVTIHLGGMTVGDYILPRLREMLLLKFTTLTETETVEIVSGLRHAAIEDVYETLGHDPKRVPKELRDNAAAKSIGHILIDKREEGDEQRYKAATSQTNEVKFWENTDELEPPDFSEAAEFALEWTVKNKNTFAQAQKKVSRGGRASSGRGRGDARGSGRGRGDARGSGRGRGEARGSGRGRGGPRGSGRGSSRGRGGL